MILSSEALPSGKRQTGPFLSEALCSHWRDGLPASMAPGLFFQGDVLGIGPAQSRAWVLTGPGKDLGRRFLGFPVHSWHLRFSAVAMSLVLPECLPGAWGPWAEAGAFPSQYDSLAFISVGCQPDSKHAVTSFRDLCSQRQVFRLLTSGLVIPAPSLSLQRQPNTGPFKGTLRLRCTLLIVCF